MSVLESLRHELDSLTATQHQRDVLEANPSRAIAAIGKARTAGAVSVLPYALSIFNSAEFNPMHADQPRGTNRHVAKKCRTCDGDRFVLYGTRTDTYNGRSASVEEYAPCPACNANCNTERMGVRCPDAAKVRERIAT